MSELLKPAGANPVGTFFVFLQLLEGNVMPMALPTSVWLILSIKRRIRTRAPTYSSFWVGDLVNMVESLTGGGNAGKLACSVQMVVSQSAHAQRPQY
jgi:hypothetical protein